jgi:CMP/dCMP kinase
MIENRSVVINGDLGSGKSTVSRELSRRLGLRRISIGDLYRDMALQRGMTTLQLNLHAELDDEIDSTVDQLQANIAESGEQLIVDSRLAWHFFKNAFKIHLITDRIVAAQRVLARPSSEVEHYSSLEEAVERLHERSESERARFLSRYGVDKYLLRNYDLICDTSRATPDEISDLLTKALEGYFGRDTLINHPPLLLIDPVRIFPTRTFTDADDAPSAEFIESVAAAGEAEVEPIRLGYADFRYFVVDGHRRLSAALRSGFRLIPAILAAERDEEVKDGKSALTYFADQVTPARVETWNELHKIELPVPEAARS